MIWLENLFFIPYIGFQEITTYATGRKSSQFYEINNVSDIIINEIVSMVIFKQKN